MAAKTNEIERQKFNAWIILVRQFKNPLLLVFIISTIVASVLGQHTEAIVIWVVMTISIVLGFWNEFRAERTVQDLLKKISFTVTVKRSGVEKVIPVREVLVGDEVALHPGSIIPADMRLTSSEGLEVNESILTGESLPTLKKDRDMAFMGTVVTGGNAHGEVVFIGMDTKFGKISQSVAKARPETEFQKGLRDFSSLLAKIAVVTVVLVITFGFFLHHQIVETVLFALTVAMGITPELLPLIVTLGLSYGARRLAKEGVIVKQFVSIEDLGNMEVLCTDKTGTLTEGKISLNSYIDPEGKNDDGVLSLALICNSGFDHGHSTPDSIDGAIMNFAKGKNFLLKEKPEKLFEIPFNFENRFMSMVVKEGGEVKLICKGSPEAIIARLGASGQEKKKLEKIVSDIQGEGLRVIAVASKELKKFDARLVKSEQDNLKMDGFLSFADVPKKDLQEVFSKFTNQGVLIKIVTGDSEIVAEKIAHDVGFHYDKVLTSQEIAEMNDEKLEKVVWDTDIFARVTPSQKMRIITALKKGRHTVGYMGDGVNDAPALHISDVGISVNTGVDVAKDAASIVLLHKSLGVIADGITQGRITFQNTIKYILMGTSSDFGNMVSAAAASIFLPFLPMTPVQVLLTDILYDTSQLSIPSDNVDGDQIKMPKSWNIGYIKRFMLLFGPISTIYDFLTFGMMYFIFKARGGFFQTGWFIESLVTEILVVFVIRTRKIPFWKSRASLALVSTCLAVVIIGLILPFSPLAGYLDFQPLPPLFFVFLIGLTVTYLILVEVGKYYLNYETRRSES